MCLNGRTEWFPDTPLCSVFRRHWEKCPAQSFPDQRSEKEQNHFRSSNLILQNEAIYLFFLKPICMRKLCLGWWPVMLKAKCIQFDMWIKGTLRYTALMSKKVDRRPRSRTQASHVPVFVIFYASVHWLLTCLHGPVMTAPHFYKFPGWYLRRKLEGPRQLRALWSFCSGALVKRRWPELLPTGALQLHASLLIREQGRPKWLRPLLSTVWDSARVQCAAKSRVTWRDMSQAWHTQPSLSRFPCLFCLLFLRKSVCSVLHV